MDSSRKQSQLPSPPPSMDLPVVDLDVYRQGSQDFTKVRRECERAAEAFITYGALVLHDSRVYSRQNDMFLDLLEDYFAQPADELRRDERPELSYQVGVTLENTETPKCAVDAPCLDVIKRLHHSQRPLDISDHAPDPKCRFFWRMAEPPPYPTQFPALNAPNVIPRAPQFEHWAAELDRYGNRLKEAVSLLSEMMAIGLGLPAKYFVDAARYGPHLLAPTASDLHRHGAKNTILAGFHTDLNFLTVHGRCRYPGLNIWARNTGTRIPVKIPPGQHLLVQAGKQLEHITGGLIKAGYHEVVVNDQTLEAMELRKRDFPGRPLIRISSTLFWHLSSDFDLVPVPELVECAQRRRAEQARLGLDEDELATYPAIKVCHQVEDELKHIALMV